MTMLKFLKLLTYFLWIIVFAGYAWHYQSLLEEYAEINLHVKNTLLYVSVETWLLVCIIMLAILSIRMVEEAGKAE